MCVCSRGFCLTVVAAFFFLCFFSCFFSFAFFLCFFPENNFYDNSFQTYKQKQNFPQDDQFVLHEENQLRRCCVTQSLQLKPDDFVTALYIILIVVTVHRILKGQRL